MSCYINDLLIFLKTKKEHTKHILIILKGLKKMKLNIDILKLKFYIQKVKFLGLIIILRRIKMNFKRLKKLKIK